MEYIHYILSSAEIILKIVISGLCGMLIGMAKKSELRPANIRVLILISMGSCIFMVIGSNSYLNPSEGFELNVIMASTIVISTAIISSAKIIGNNGSKESIVVAVSIWIAGAIGMVIGNSLYFVGIIITLFSYFIFNYPIIAGSNRNNSMDSK